MLSNNEGLILFVVIALFITVFMLFLRHDAPFAHSNAFGRHLNFDNYHMDTIIKVLYFFTLFANVLIAYLIMGLVIQANNYSDDIALTACLSLWWCSRCCSFCRAWSARPSSCTSTWSRMSAKSAMRSATSGLLPRYRSIRRSSSRMLRPSRALPSGLPRRAMPLPASHLPSPKGLLKITRRRRSSFPPFRNRCRNLLQKRFRNPRRRMCDAEPNVARMHVTCGPNVRCLGASRLRARNMWSGCTLPLRMWPGCTQDVARMYARDG